MKTFKLNPLVLAMAVALPVAPHVYAQEEAIDEIQVTGFRASVAKSLDTKRDAAGAVDAITASDIAEFPDNNLAESLQRIPGVAISRSGGEGRNISVRGLGSNFTRVLINGMEGISTTGGTDATGGNNRGRGFDFNTFSSDLFSSLVIRKTGAAEFDEGSLGAIVEMKADQPFNHEGFVFTANAQIGYNDLSKENDPSVGFLISDTFADGTIGALLSASHSDRSILDQGNSTVRWSNAIAEKFGKVKGVATTATSDVVTAFHPRIPRYDVYNTDLTRDGLSGSLQFKPTDDTEISLDALVSKYEATRTEKFIEGSINGNNSAVNVVDYAIEGNSLVYAQLTGVKLLSESRQDEMTTDFSQYTLNAKHSFSDSFRVKGLLGRSKSDFQNPIQNTVIMQADNQEMTWDYRGGNADTSLVFGPGASIPTNWSVSSVRQRPQGTVNTYDTGSFGLEYDLNDTFTLKAGASKKEFEMETFQTAYAGGEGLGSKTSTTANNNCAGTKGEPAPTCYVLSTFAADQIINFKSDFGSWLLPNRALVMSSADLWNKPMVTNRGSTFTVSEDTIAEYLQVDFNTELFGMPFRGDVGVRHFSTDQTSTGWVNTSNGYVQKPFDHSYSDVLPALNLVLSPIDEVQLRASYSEGIARPGLGSLVGDTNITVSGGSRTVSSGNPLLKPTGSKNYDLGVEWYFAEESVLSLALFRKELSTQVQTVSESKTLTEYFTSRGYTEADAAAAASLACAANYGLNTANPCHETQQWSVSAPVNGPGGPLNGYEIGYQQPFTFLPGFGKYFGFTGSYTHVTSDMDYVNSNGVVLSTASLVNLSPTSSSATLYFEKDAFHARVSVAHRAGYLTNAVIDQNGNNQNGTNATTNVDAQVSYQINDHFKVTLDALNLTNEADDQWVDAADKRLSYYHETGTQYNLSVNYKF
jgi:TonB-dependent receptor